MNGKSLDYRPEIDGLRALAILPVIFFHAGFSTFSGGFIGVDVFFVISGYLIATIIQSELKQDTFSLAKFYEKRARRILPALMLVLLFCLPIAWVYLLPRHMLDFSQSLVAILAFSSNVLFFLESGYFHAAAEFKPLLHTWSLSVEEQFYFLLPFILILVHRYATRWLVIVLSALMAASFACGEWLSVSAPAAAYFLLPGRAWEPLLGALIGVCLQKDVRCNIPLWMEEVAALVGMALILYAVFFYSKAIPWPGFYTLAPTIGAALVIVFATSKTWTGRFLANRFFVGIGLLSYSAYLWHQPIFAFARHRSLTPPSDEIFALLIIISICLSYVSWRFVELPLRDNRRWPSKRFVILLAPFYLAIITFGLLGHYSKGFKTRHSLSDNIKASSARHQLRGACNPSDNAVDVLYKPCLLGKKNTGAPAFAVFGDSHADSLNPVFHALGQERGFQYAYMGMSACPPLLGVDVSANRAPRVCENHNEKIYGYVRDRGVKNVFLVARWSLYTQGEYNKEMTRSFLQYGRANATDVNASMVNFSAAVKNTLHAYRLIGSKIFIVLQVPQHKIQPLQVYSRIHSFGLKNSSSASMAVEKASVSLQDHSALQSFNRSFFLSLPKTEDFYVINPDPVFCNDERCLLGNSETSFYLDDDHVNPHGAMRLLPIINKAMDEMSGNKHVTKSGE